MPKKEKWDYVDGDATRKSVYLSDKTWEKVEQYKNENGIRSNNMAFNEIITEHLAERGENNSEMNLPSLYPRFHIENPNNPPPFIEQSALCTVTDYTYSTSYNGGNIPNPPPVVPILYLQNIGTTSAKEVHLKIYDNYGRKLDDVDRFALSVCEWHRTKVNLEETKAGKIKGTYQDVTGKTHSMDIVFHYPP